VGKAVRAFEQAGAHVEEVKVGIKRPQKQLSDLWCRLIMPLNLQTLESFRDAGVDVLKDHRDDLPPEYLFWVEQGYKMSALDFFHDQAARSEIYDAFQGVLDGYRLLVTPTLACLPVDNASDGNTKGPDRVNGEPVNPLIGWCLTYPVNFTGHPAASIPAGLTVGNLPVGMQIIGRRYADADVLAASAAFERIQPLPTVSAQADHFRSFRTVLRRTSTTTKIVDPPGALGGATGTRLATCRPRRTPAVIALLQYWFTGVRNQPADDFGILAGRAAAPRASVR
jgi:Asp-tRNA(Asn)/Glu-tRNA(Gln) amidotransferase A subunit family amidase